MGQNKLHRPREHAMNKQEAAVQGAALRYLARREYCVKELVNKLTAKGFERNTAAEIVSNLTEQNLVNDGRFARDLIRVRIDKGYGPFRIEYELRQRGVDQELISNCLAQINENWKQRLEQLVAKKYRNQPVESFRDWTKRANFLRNRGFDAELIHDVLGKYTSEILN